MNRHWKKIVVLLGGLVLLAIIIVRLIDTRERPKRVASILNIPLLPNSVHLLECKAEFIPTDVVDTCSIEIDPSDFPSLFRGYNFTESPTTGTSHSVVFTKVGPEFAVATEFIAEPKKFKDGGNVKVYTDRERKRAVIDLYIE